MDYIFGKVNLIRLELAATNLLIAVAVWIIFPDPHPIFTLAPVDVVTFAKHVPAAMFTEFVT